MSVKDRLIDILKGRNTGAFLFIGSGFSRRYLGLENWAGLLEKFCVTGKPFEYYYSTANGNLPATAKLLALDFHDYWWRENSENPDFEKIKGLVADQTSALRIEISRYLSDLDVVSSAKKKYKDEIDILSNLNVDGVITTNWDLFIENVFPDYKTYIGQDELLFSNTQEIGEIYKIHGCATDPRSLVLTSDDYGVFHNRNPYLAAKLITIFVEHPVVFIGYSLSDENIIDLLAALSLCIGKERWGQLRRNLIFVQRLGDGDEPEVSDTYITVNNTPIPIVLVKTNNYSEVYEALTSIQRKIPARILRYCKEQLYELVNSLEPEKKLCVVDLDEIENKEDVEFLVGVGVAAEAKHQEEIAKIGYGSITVIDLILDSLSEKSSYDAESVIGSISQIGRNTIYVPIYKYLRNIGVNNEKEYLERKLNIDKWVRIDESKFRLKSYESVFLKRSGETMKELIEGSTPQNAAVSIPFLDKSLIDMDLLRDFLIEHKDKMENNNYASNFRKLASFYDRLKWGWVD